VPKQPVAAAFHSHYQSAAPRSAEEKAPLQGKPGINPDVDAPAYIQLFPAYPRCEALQHLWICFIVPKNKETLPPVSHQGTKFTEKFFPSRSGMPDDFVFSAAEGAFSPGTPPGEPESPKLPRGILIIILLRKMAVLRSNLPQREGRSRRITPEPSFFQPDKPRYGI
jgi:hypothetical protein